MRRRYLLLVDEDGRGKRIPVGEVRHVMRGRVGVNVSTVPLAVSLVVDDPTAELLLMTKAGKVQRVRVADVPVRRRASDGGRPAKGARIIRLLDGDRIASGTLATPVETRPAALRTPSPGDSWPGGRVGLKRGESVTDVRILNPQRSLAEITPGGTMAVTADEWKATDVHQPSRYWCAHCGVKHPDPESVYTCIGNHARSTATAAASRRPAHEMALAAVPGLPLAADPAVSAAAGHIERKPRTPSSAGRSPAVALTVVPKAA